MTTGDVLIVGAGVVGASVAYHLTRLEAGDALVDPGRVAPDRFDSWREAKIRETALGHYQGIYDAH